MVEPLWERLLVLLVDKVLFGAVVAFVAFRFQRRLERVKRTEAVFAENAKVVMRAFAAAMSHVYELRSLVIAASGNGWGVEDRPRAEAKVEELVGALKQDRHLVGATFFSFGMRLAHAARAATKLDALDEILEHDFEIESVKNAMLAAIPRFARMPTDDPQFASPKFGHALEEAGLRDEWLGSAEPTVDRPKPAARLSGAPR
jgi:hypothetical protein